MILGIHGFAVGCTFLHARLLVAAGFSIFARFSEFTVLRRVLLFCTHGFFLPPVSPFLHDFKNSRFCGGFYFFARTGSVSRQFLHFCTILGIHGLAVGSTFLHARVLFAAGFSIFARF
jgi:hypothetical protein